MKIGILGCRGIPNHYGGFEQFASYLAVGLRELGSEVWVYNSHKHPCQDKQWKGVNLIHCYDPEYRIGQAGQYIYDLNCIHDSRSRDFDILFQLGYTSNSVWYKLLPKKPVIVTNMDGLEWKRSKYSRPVQRLLKFTEKLAVVSSDHLVADSEAIQDYLLNEYQAVSTFIPYGAEVFEEPDISRVEKLGLKARQYSLLIARLQPDNHIEEIIKGVLASGSTKPLLVIGNYSSRYGNYLKNTYKSELIQFHGADFNRELLDNLRYYAGMYFHGHSAGGTNPSLLEAMAASARIFAHNNPFNRSVTGDNALYFDDFEGIASILSRDTNSVNWKPMLENNLDKIKTVYTWEKVIHAYYQLFLKLSYK